MRAHKNQSPADISVTDSLREWAAKKHGAMYLPDVYLVEWQDTAKANGSLYADAVQALQNWINWSSPGGRFYRPADWEVHLARAKKMEHGKRSSKPDVTFRGKPTVTLRSTGDVAHAALASLKAKAGL